MNQKSQDLDFLKNTMVQNINRLLYKKNWSIRQLSDQAGLPYESIKKLVGGKIKNPTIYTISKVCDALDCSIDYLLGRSVINTIDQKSLPPRVFNLLAEIAYFESRIADYNQSHKTDCVSVLTPTGIVQDGMVFDSISTDIVDLSPTYFDNDILLIGKDRFPDSGETGIFLIGNKVYIRKYIPGIRLELAPINGDKNSLFIDNIDDVHYFGRVLTVVRDA